MGHQGAVQIINRVPTIQEYQQLSQSVGWGEIINFDAAAKGLPQSVFGVVAETGEGEIVGMGRVVGDGAMYFYLQDIAVDPDYQGRGIGTRLVGAMMDFLRENAAPQSFIALFSAPDALAFYERFSFQERDMVGVFTVRELIEGI